MTTIMWPQHASLSCIVSSGSGLHVCTLPITVAGVILDIYGFVIKVRNVFSTKIILYKTTKTVVVTTVVEQ